MLFVWIPFVLFDLLKEKMFDKFYVLTSNHLTYKVVGCVDRRRGRHEGGVLMYVRVLMLVMMHLRTQRVGGRGLGRLRGTMMVGRGRPGGRRGGGEEARVQFPPQ